MRLRPNFRGRVVAALFLLAALSTPLSAGRRVPQDGWLAYADPADAGFDASKLEAARQTWEQLPSAAFMVVADGAVVAAWGDVGRRYMCHSVRKSFLSALYGIAFDRGDIELNKTMADLGIDDEPDPLLETEKQARILDLLKARSGVFHPAAYAGRTDSQPRGSQGPGRYFAYNNWDFNTLVTIFEQETGEPVFEAFDRYFARPLGMEDWRLSDGYYHYERDKSKHPAYPFRISARDAARFGLLFARLGAWGEQRILSRNWVRRSAALYSIDNDVMGYGLMWWVLREPRFEPHGMFAALGVGNQMIAALPDSDLVIVNRADTYQGQGTPTEALLDLVEQVLEAKTGEPAGHPRLIPLEVTPDPALVEAATAEALREFEGEWAYPPAPLGLPPVTTVRLSVEGGHLLSYTPRSGTFRLYLQPDGSLQAEDSRDRFYPIREEQGRLSGLAGSDALLQAALTAAAGGEQDRAENLLARLSGDTSNQVEVARVVMTQLRGDQAAALQAIGHLSGRIHPREIEGRINAAGYALLRQNPQAALRVFQLNTEAFPEAFNTWDSLGEAHMTLGNDEDAIRCYRRSLELNPDNGNAEQMIQRIEAGESEPPRRR